MQKTIKAVLETYKQTSYAYIYAHIQDRPLQIPDDGLKWTVAGQAEADEDQAV